MSSSRFPKNFTFSTFSDACDSFVSFRRSGLSPTIPFGGLFGFFLFSSSIYFAILKYSILLFLS